MSCNNSYHSTIKISYALDIQEKWLPKHFRDLIPRSTSHSWKNIEADKFVGYEYATDIKDSLDDVKLIFDKLVEREKRIFLAYTRIKITIINLIGKKALKSLLKENSHKVVQVIENVKSSFEGGTKQVCKLLDIKYRAYLYWKQINQHACALSARGICLKKVPIQSTANEVTVIKRFLVRQKYAHWPIRSIWCEAIRKKKTLLSLNSWYRYNKIYQFRDTKTKKKFRKEYIPLKAEAPNHIWHADITIYKTLDNVRHYVYLIVDNYSKLILNYQIHHTVSAKVRLDTIRQTIKQEFGDDLTASKKVDLIVDGGVENNNRTVEQYIRASQMSINKKIALKDIVQSNSMVEASNKILKHQYLYRKHIPDGKALAEYLPDIIYEYCHLRPNYDLGARTPYEAHNEIYPDLNVEARKSAVKERIRINKISGCEGKCS